MSPKKYDSTVARIAGNLMSANAQDWVNPKYRVQTVELAVMTARMIVAETKRTEPESTEG